MCKSLKIKGLGPRRPYKPLFFNSLSAFWSVWHRNTIGMILILSILCTIVMNNINIICIVYVVVVVLCVALLRSNHKGR